ncbi:acyl carrier protein [Hasllibacter halocynthiae]|uniref:Acyl carrier protein n=1 Tax=Hasllibacter halocynthiae TaxID=595589 RepID=A0A2T0X8J1_9RHOB|nr:phosphopantetheine-binding protein [Hasllibacter halocynthiae]PRY95237.1 acyl carrier protein [Hasllibacter halocynthiae]
MPSDIRSRTRTILAEQALLNPSDVADDQSLQDLGIDSLALVESIFAIEEAFDIQVPFNANDPQASEFDISSVGAICGAVEHLVREQKGAA